MAYCHTLAAYSQREERHLSLVKSQLQLSTHVSVIAAFSYRSLV
jgi:hypothetical protein